MSKKILNQVDGPKGQFFSSSSNLDLGIDERPVSKDEVKFGYDSVEQRGFNDQDLFNNPFVKAAKESMSLQQIENFKKMGEKYFSAWDFDKGNPEEILDVAVAELSEAIKSGLHPSDLEENDIAILSAKLGKDWYTRFGYDEEDLKGIRV